MNLNRFLKKERLLWHNHFIPSFIAGGVVALIALVYELTISNVILFASVGASAAILTNSKSHHLTKLYTVISAYFIAIILSLLIFTINKYYPLPTAFNLFILVSVTSLALFLLNSFHPPAISASISFILLQGPVIDLLYLFLAIIILLVIIRLITYIVLMKFSFKEFKKEFKKGFREELKKSF